MPVRCLYVHSYVRNSVCDELSSEWRNDENRGCEHRAIRHNENDVTMTIAGLWRHGDWRHMATGCTALVHTDIAWLQSKWVAEYKDKVY